VLARTVPRNTRAAFVDFLGEIARPRQLCADRKRGRAAAIHQ